jgi:glycine/D-amino acid oxidase-like deaminating enzyme
VSRPARSAIVVGGGIYGVTTALELRRRGHDVELADPGPIPHPQASSTDLSKAVRLDYGDDEFYASLAAAALEGWRAWNRRWDRPVFHEVGILLLTSHSMQRGGFEGDSFELLSRRGVPLERLDAATLHRRFPAWAASDYREGYFNPWAGWVESAAAVARLAEEAGREGVRLRAGARMRRLVESGSRIVGVELEGGERLLADLVIVAAGAWTPWLLPHLSDLLRPVGQPVVHFAPRDRTPVEGVRFPVWCGDIATTGWYGFPVNRDGVLKLGHHGPGRPVRVGDPLRVEEAEVARVAEFVERTFPLLRDAPVCGGRLCLYCDSFDGNFLIDHDPARPGLVVAAGGSGHGFKFAPVLGSIVADVAEGRDNAWAPRFRWRAPGPRATERARYLD